MKLGGGWSLVGEELGGVGEDMIKILCVHIWKLKELMLLLYLIIIMNNYCSLGNNQNTWILTIVASLLCGSGSSLLSVPGISFFFLCRVNKGKFSAGIRSQILWVWGILAFEPRRGINGQENLWQRDPATLTTLLQGLWPLTVTVQSFKPASWV